MSEAAQDYNWDDEVSANTSTAGNSEFGRLRPLKDGEEAAGCVEVVPSSVIEGVLSGVTKNKFGKKEFELKLTNGKKFFLTQSGNLAYRLKDAGVKIGDAVSITYNGKTPMSNGPFKGTPAHNFDVEKIQE